MSSTQAMTQQVARWDFDTTAGRIAAFDADGRLLMAIAANPLFGARLAAAFSSPGPGRLEPGTPESWATVVELASSWRQAGPAPAPLDDQQARAA